MPLWLQHLLVLALVGVALVVVIRQAIGALRLRQGKIGSCCAKGCAASPPEKRSVFIPIESLKRRKR